MERSQQSIYAAGFSIMASTPAALVMIQDKVNERESRLATQRPAESEWLRCLSWNIYIDWFYFLHLIQYATQTQSLWREKVNNKCGKEAKRSYWNWENGIQGLCTIQNWRRHTGGLVNMMQNYSWNLNVRNIECKIKTHFFNQKSRFCNDKLG